MLKKVTLLFLILATPFIIYAGDVIRGEVSDADSDTPLPAANIQIEGTMRGAITNRDGSFILEIEDFPCTLHVSYIGYASSRIILNAPPDKPLNIGMQPVILEGEAIYVSAEDPAMSIMRKVIERKQIWREKLNTFKAEAYSRLVLANDSGIVSIAESMTEAFWDDEKGSREVIKSRRQTNNMKQEQNWAVSSHIPNFYDDDIEINGFNMVGPTNPEAFDYYRFKLKSRRAIDDKVVYDIEVIPRTKLQPTFTGRISVLDEAYAMIDVRLKPSESILFPPPIESWDLYYNQQFSNFGKSFWLPVDVRIGGTIKIAFTGLEFPKIKYNQISHLTNYQVNIPLPDTLYQSDKLITVDSLSVDKNLFTQKPEPVIPFSQDEEQAYEEIDSTMTMVKAFKPKGFLSRFIKIEDGSDSPDTTKKSLFGKLADGFSPWLWYNRVDQFHLGLTYSRTLMKLLEWKIYGAWNSGPENWTYGAKLEYTLSKKYDIDVSAGYLIGTHERGGSFNYSKTMVSLLPLFARADYFDYYWRRAGHLKISRFNDTYDVGWALTVKDEWHSSLEKSADYSLINGNYTQRPNPAIEPGNLRSVQLKLNYGDEFAPLGIVGQRGIELKIENSTPDIWGGDYDFTKLELRMDWRVATFLKRRLLPNAFDVRLAAGYAFGELPVQNFFQIDGNLYAFSPFGTLHALAGRPYEGDKYVALFWEHNFRTVPFEIIGLRSLAKKGVGIIVYGGHGRTWIDDDTTLNFRPNYPDRFHHEIGISVNSLFGLLRIDFTRRLDRPGFYVGLSLARFF